MAKPRPPKVGKPLRRRQGAYKAAEASEVIQAITEMNEMPAGACVGISPNAADEDSVPYNPDELVFFDWDMSVLNGMASPRRCVSDADDLNAEAQHELGPPDESEGLDRRISKGLAQLDQGEGLPSKEARRETLARRSLRVRPTR
jgi:hypothetical protein